MWWYDYRVEIGFLSMWVYRTVFFVIATLSSYYGRYFEKLKLHFFYFPLMREKRVDVTLKTVVGSSEKSKTEKKVKDRN